MKKVWFVHPGHIDRPTGGYTYARNMIAELRKIGWDVETIALPGNYPFPSKTDELSASEHLSGIADGSRVVVDGLAFGALPKAAERHRRRLFLVALVHHPLAHETGFDRDTALQLRESETHALACARQVIATSRLTAGILEKEFRVSAGRISVAPPGLVPFGRAPCRGEPPIILSVGSIIPRKGHDILIEALRSIVDLDWRCRVIGEADGVWAARIRKAARDLEDRVVFTGSVLSSNNEFLNADLFVIPSRYEGYGMAYAEALSAGLPIIGCPVGVLPDILPEDAGIIIPIDDVHALSQALRKLLRSPEYRRVMAERAYAAGQNLPSWTQSAHVFSTALDEASHAGL